MWLRLIAGKNWDFISLGAYSFLLLAFCAFGLGFALLVWKIIEHTRKSHITKPTTTEPAAITLPGQMAKLVITRASKPVLLVLAGLAIGGVAGGFAGYMIGQDARGRRSYTDVLVLARHDSTHYTLEPQWMKPWEITTCSPMDWDQGQKMQFLNFQYHPACDDVENGSFVFYAEADGHRRLFSQEVLNAGN